MPLYDTNLTSGDMLLDGDYAPPAAADVVAFWQAPNVSLDWIRPVEPFDGEVDVPRGENVRAHLLGDYGAPTYSSIAMTMNTEALQVDVTTAPGGIYVARVLSERFRRLELKFERLLGALEKNGIHVPKALEADD